MKEKNCSKRCSLQYISRSLKSVKGKIRFILDIYNIYKLLTDLIIKITYKTFVIVIVI